ncbi:leucine-rich repeat-containing protein 46 isoform X2 [Eublepharis macularius]|uniref:Leucine-rich repeat-containing protein 46 isoform X2 n=1 Tax=Eublepharis macularius TaxID=481883 RepID=A0AA97K4G5_EUBMA|nr:leucine-rich repeat-containing protein 46 isoform X2 [Eublepharis macularius]
MPGENIHSCFKEGVNLTKSLIAQRNLFASVEKEVPESISQALTSLLVLRLDRERISCIPNLQGLEQIHSIYLQQNQIEKIENLSCFPNLKFLSLAGNRISRVENLRALPKLQFLDLSHNHIKSLNTDELPQSLLVLELTGNKCTKQNSYRESVLAALPHLIELDAHHVPNRKAREEMEESLEDSDEDIPELSQPLSTEKDFFVDLHNEFTSRSERRRREALSEHEAHLEELKDRQNLRHLLLNASPQGPSPPGPKTPTMEALTPQTECHGAPRPSLETASSTDHEGLSIPKGKSEVRSQVQVKGQVSSMAKYVTKAKK